MRKMTIEQKWYRLSEAARDEPRNYPTARNAKLWSAGRVNWETASRINQWLSSSELKPPR